MTFICGVLLLTLTAGPPPLSAIPLYDRLSGVGQYETAAEIARAGGPAETAVVAVGAMGNSYDALVAGPLAAAKKAPLLLTEGNRLTAVTRSALKDLGVKKVYLIGGTGVIKAGVEEEIRNLGLEVTRLAGYDAAGTSVQIARELGEVSAFVLTGGRGQDALSIAPVAAARAIPVLYTDNRNQLPQVLTEYIGRIRHEVAEVYVIGGPGVISEAQSAQLPGQVRRLAGNDAYETNVAVIRNFADELDFAHVYVANGQTMVDALAGAPLAAAQKAPLLLTDNAVLKGAAFVNGKITEQSKITALGGTAVVAPAILEELSGPAPADPGNPPVYPLSIDSFKAADRQTLQAVFNHSVAEPAKLQWTIEKQGELLSGYAVTWNQERTEITFAFPAALTDGRYTLKAEGAGFFPRYDTAACNVLGEAGTKYTVPDLSPLAGFKDFKADSTVVYARKIEVQAEDANHNLYPVDPRDIISVTAADPEILTAAQVQGNWYVAGRDVAAGGNREERSTVMTVRLNTLNGVQTLEQTVSVSPQEPEVQKLRTGYWRLGFPSRKLDLSAPEQTYFEFTDTYDALSGKIVGVFGLDQYGVWRDLILDPDDVAVKDTQYAPSNAFTVFLDNTISTENKDIFRLASNTGGITKNVDIRVTLSYDQAVKEVTVKILAP